MLGSFVKWLILLVGGLLALTIVIPSLNPGDLIAGLGIGSVAIGFAFKDILQNWLAGLLILIQRPFGVGDQIVVNGYEGTVEWIETRATIIAMYDGRRAIIPNADVYSNAVTVNTARPTRRSQYDVGIGYGDDIEAARNGDPRGAGDGRTASRPIPKPEVLVWELAGSSVNLRVRWWTQSKRTDVVHVQAAVLEAVKVALDEAGHRHALPDAGRAAPRPDARRPTASAASSAKAGRASPARSRPDRPAQLQAVGGDRPDGGEGS